MKKSKSTLGLIFLFMLIFFAALSIGRYPRPFFLPFEYLKSDQLAQKLVLNLRLPRVFAASLLGAGLSLAGSIFQKAFKNPLADAGILGVSHGAGFGAAFSIVLFGSAGFLTQLFAVVFAGIALFFVFFIIKNAMSEQRLIAILLAGIAVSAIFSAGIGFLKYIADPLDELPNIVFWLLGDLSSVTWKSLSAVAPFVVLCLSVVFLFRWRLNALNLQQDVVRAMGINTDLLYFLFLGLAVCVTAVLTSFAGIVSWVGLIIPNVVRILVGNNALRTVPLDMIFGAGFVVICDTIARSLVSGEIPLGILTALFGALIFIFVIYKKPLFLGKE